MHPEIHINMLAVLACVVANFVLGSLWYGPLFGKAWAKELNFPPDFKPTGAQIGKAMILMVLGSLLMAFVLAHMVAVWRPSTWKLAGDYPASWKYGVYTALFTWLGFQVPLLFNPVAWENRTWKLFAINATHQLASLQIAGQILANWR